MRFDYLFKDCPGIREAQVIQIEPSGIVIRVVPRAAFSSAEEKQMRRAICDWISPTLGVEFEVVDEIPRFGGGKFRAVVSKLPQVEHS